MLKGSTTVWAWLRGSAIDQQFPPEVLKVLGTRRRSKKSSTLLDGGLQNCPDGFGQQLIAAPGDLAGRPCGMNPRREECFIGVNVADSRYYALVQQKLPYRRFAAAAPAVKISAGECLAKRFRTMVCKQRVLQRIILSPEDQPETAIVIETEIPAVAQENIEMVVFARGNGNFVCLQETGHAEMEDQVSIWTAEQKILASPFDGLNGLSGKFCGDFRCHRPAHSRIAHDDPGHRLTCDAGNDPPSDNLNFGEFRHFANLVWRLFVQRWRQCRGHRRRRWFPNRTWRCAAAAHTGVSPSAWCP
jgi:hypothetical protein